MIVRPVKPNDADSVAEIYNHYIRTAHSTFEIDEIEPVEMRRRFVEVAGHGHPFIVIEGELGIIGYCYAHEYRSRSAYKYTAEISIYIRPGHEARGVGTRLYQALFTELKRLEFHTVVAGISLPNDASVGLHEKFGMTKVAHLRQVGRKFDRWIDVGYWQLLLD